MNGVSPRLLPRDTPLYRLPLHTVSDHVRWVLSVWGPMAYDELVFHIQFKDREDKEKQLLENAIEAELLELPKGNVNMVLMALQDLVAQRRVVCVGGKYQCLK